MQNMQSCCILGKSTFSLVSHKQSVHYKVSPGNNEHLDVAHPLQESESCIDNVMEMNAHEYASMYLHSG